MKLSLCMIVKNEEHSLPVLLESVQGIFDQTVIVDTGSTDKTVEIAEFYGAEVHHFKWNDSFADARNESIKYATGEYFMYLDADELLIPKEARKLLSFKSVIEEHRDCNHAYLLYEYCQLGHSARRIEQVRILPNLPGIKFHRRKHANLRKSGIELGIDVIRADITITHTGYTMYNRERKRIRAERPLLKMYAEDKDDHMNPYYLCRDYYLGYYPENAVKWAKILLDTMEKYPKNENIEIKEEAKLLVSKVLSTKGIFGGDIF